MDGNRHGCHFLKPVEHVFLCAVFAFTPGHSTHSLFPHALDSLILSCSTFIAHSLRRTTAVQIALYGSIAWKHPFGIYQVLDWAKDFGWDAVDARGMTLDVPGGPKKQLTAFGYDMLGPRQIRPSARKQIRAHCEKIGIPIICLYVPAPVNLEGELGDGNRSLFKEFLQLAADLGIPRVRAINNTTESYCSTPFTVEQAFENTVSGLQDVGQFAADLGIGILIENNENTTTSCADDLLAMQNALQGVCRIEIAYDATNAYFQGLNELDELEELAGSISFLHVKNVRRHNVTSDDVSHTPALGYMPRGDFAYEWASLADGDIRWETVLKAALDTGFDGPITFEYVNPFKGMPADYWHLLRDPEFAAEHERAYLAELLADLTSENS